MTSPSASFAQSDPAYPAPALERADCSFVQGFVLTTRDALLTPTRFYEQLGPGPLGRPFVFAAVSLALPLIAADIAGYYATGGNGEAVPKGVFALLSASLMPLIAAAIVVAIQGLLWTGVSRALGARVPLQIALRAMAYLTSIASTFGIAMTLSGFAPESAFCVIVWYLSMFSAYLFSTYATYRLAQGPYAFRPVRAALTVWLFQSTCGLTVIAAL
ncbi:MAG: hypothetical protein JWN48_3119, partial [Myxococcaceae bacterium]|nr:hypothetical protein [Myxococcaceae bacterium]